MIAGKLLRVLGASLALAIASLAPCAYADDTSAGVALPGLRSLPVGSVTVSSASITWKDGQVELQLAVQGRPGVQSLTIDFPRFGWMGESEPYPDRQFPELQILLDRVPAPVENTFAAFVGSVDVTEAVRASGADPFVITETPPFVSSSEKTALERLEKLGAVTKLGQDFLAAWTVQRKIRVQIQAGSHALSLRYKSRPGYGLFSFAQVSASSYQSTYCLLPDVLRAVFGPKVVDQRFVTSEVAIPVSTDDRSPASVTVTVDATIGVPETRSLIAFCQGDGKGAWGQGPHLRAPARADSKGVVHILSLSVSGGQK